MTMQHVQPSRRTIHALAVFISLALLALILAACTGSQPAAAPTDAPIPTVAAAAAQPTAAPTPAPAATQAKPAAPAPVGNLTQRAEAGAVTVDITPLNLADAKASTLDFKVVMDTHSVELGGDLAKLAVLKIGDNEVAAKGWQAPAGGGHHVEGTLNFSRVTAAGQPILEGATSLTVVIRNLAGVPERKFTWNLGPAGAATGGNMAMGTGSAVTGTMPMGQGMGMAAGSAMTGTMPMTNTMPMTGTMPMSGDMMGMMSEMMKMMQGMMGASSAITGVMPMTGTMPMGQGGMSGDMTGMMAEMMKMMQGMMGASSAMSGTMPMTGTMPMSGDMSGMMAQMQGMMAMMKNMPPAEHQKMMMDMMGQMGTLMGQMGGMSQGNQAQMMGMMAQMMEMMKGMAPGAQGQMLPQMMNMMAQMMQMAGGGAGMGNMSGAGSMNSMGGMAGHGAAIPAAGVPEATAKVGGQPLTFKIENGVKVFELTASPVRWAILGDVKVTAWAYNGMVPGPMIRVTEGDKVRIVLKNQLPEATSIHWHGIPVPNAMDGVTPIEPGKSFTYEFTAPPAGTFMYHSHMAADKQMMIGLYAPFIVDPKTQPASKPAVDVTWMLSEWRIGPDGQTYPAMPMAGGEPNYFTINGKSFPETAAIEVKKGQRVRVRLANVGQFTHPMHLHGINFKIVAYDGVSLPPEQQIVRNTVPVNPGELVDIEFVADNVGTWLFHCHVLHHVTNDGAEPGGLVALVKVTE